MEKHLRRRNSRTMTYENDHPGCLWGVLHFFDFHQRLHIRKMLRDRGHGDGTHAAGGIKIMSAKPNIPATGKEHDIMDIEPNFLMEDRINSRKKGSGKAHTRTLIAEEMSKERSQKQRIPHFSRSMRTISIHHLECNDYVRPDEMTSERKTPRAVLHPHGIDSSASSEHIPLLPKAPDEAIYGTQCEVCGNMNTTGHDQLDEPGNLLVEKQVLLQQKLNEAKNVLLEQQSVDDKELRRDVALHRSKSVLDALELFNANREIFLKIIQEPNIVLRNSLQGQQDSVARIVLSKSSSFPLADFSDRTAGLSKLKHKRKETESFAEQEGRFQSGNSPSIPSTIDFSKDAGAEAVASMVDDEVGHKSETAGTGINCEFSLESKNELKNKRDDGTARNHFKSIKQRIKDEIRENRKERLRISMDGILHKVPYGFKASQDLKGERSGTWEGRDRPSSSCGSDMISSANNKHAHRDIRRSQSLTESLDSYSQLFEFSLSKEPRQHISERLRLAHEPGGSLARDSSKKLGRIFSLPEFESYFPGKNDQIVASSDAFYSRTSSMDLTERNAAIDFDCFYEQKSVGSLVNTEEHIILDVAVENAGLDHAMENNVFSTIDGRPDQHLLGNAGDGGVMHDALDDVTTGNIRCTPLHELAIGPDMDHTDKPGKPSPISVLDSYFQEDLISPAKFSASEDSELRPRNIHFELDSLADPENQSAADATNVVETAVADFSEVENQCKHTGFDAPDVQVDCKDEAEFRYVRNILNKSGFSSDKSLGTWYCPDQPVDPSLFEEMEDSPHEVVISRYVSDINLDHAHLFDLINEVLLEIYERSSAVCPWISCSDSRIRPTSMGHHVLKEVWANISWHLSSQPQLNPTLEYVVGRDLAKKDGWMNIKLDTECVGLELEALIFDDLLDEAILQFLDLPRLPCTLF